MAPVPCRRWFGAVAGGAVFALVAIALPLTLVSCSGAQTHSDVATDDGADADKKTENPADSALPGAAKPFKLPELPPVLMGKLVGRRQLAAKAHRDASLPTDDELDEAWARVFMRSNPGPYQYVAYEITARGKAGVISHTRGTMGRKDPVMRTELIDREKLRGIMGRLRQLGAAKLVDPGPLPGTPKALALLNNHNSKTAKAKRRKSVRDAAVAIIDGDDDDKRWPDASEVPIYELSFRLGGVTRSVVVADPYSSDDRRYSQFINHVRSSVIETVGDVGWYGGTSADTKSGYLFVDSVPSATVTLDGVRLPEKTPIFSFAASPGKHEVVLENELHGLKRTYKIQIKQGVTTSLEVDLR